MLGSGPLGRPVGARVAPGLLCSQGPVHSWSQTYSDSEISSLPFSMASVSHNYTMQEFALQHFRKPQTL